MSRYLVYLIIFFAGQMFHASGQTAKSTNQTAKSVADAVKAAKATANSVKALFDSTQTVSAAARDSFLHRLDSIQADSLRLDSIKNDSIPVDSIRIDSLLPDSIQIDSLVNDTLTQGVDSLLPETQLADSLQLDSLIKQVISLRLDSLQADSLLKDSLRLDSIEKAKKIQQKPDTLLIISKHYKEMMEKYVVFRDSVNENLTLKVPDAYYSQLLSAPTYYGAVLHQVLARPDSLLQADDPKLKRRVASYNALAQLYVQHPELVTQTETELKQQGSFRSDINDKLQTNDQLAEKVKETIIAPTVDEEIEVITRRPNFWKFSGMSNINFNQAYFSDNWPGGQNSYSGVAKLHLNANFNNQSKITWTNNFVAELGFVTTNKNEKRRVFQPNTNTLRYTTNWGYNIYKTISASGQLTMSTYMVPKYQSNSDKVEVDILSPLDITIAPGLKYSFSFGKKKKISGNINVAPLAYNIRYVQRNSIVKRHGVRPGHHSKHTFGPNITMNTNMQIFKPLSWSQRFRWYSNLHLTQIEWEHNFNITINKLISASLNIYPRIDDSSRQYKHKGRYLRFKQAFGVGMTYNF